MSTLSDTSNKYALAALRERRAELAGEITAAEQHLRHLREAILHVDGTLRLFDPDADPSKIAAKRPYKRTKLFGAGKLNRLILDALRKAGRPLATAEVVDAIVAELGFGEDAAKGLRNRVRANLLYLSKVRGELCGKLGDDGGLKAAYRG
ncbi:hypothetical protein P7D22_13585, partial [Lichenihabitans sp. Uapishka_5]|nr:hypothetical protein [Lichenihabitans sp. Uapishka_5]